MSSISVTKAASLHIKKQLKNRQGIAAIRLGVKTAGCSGLAYVLEFVDTIEETDHVFEHGDFSLVIDPKSLVYLDGTELDFVKEGLNEGFAFNNPNVKNECGCGESFHV